MNFFRENNSVWVSSEIMPKFFPLTQDVYADVCVVGGGIAVPIMLYLFGMPLGFVLLIWFFFFRG